MSLVEGAPTERLYYRDCYLREFTAQVVAVDGSFNAYLDRSAFYPASGGQPPDWGTLNSIRVVEVEEEENGFVRHQLEAPIATGAVNGVVDWGRRFDHMQQHTGQHLLSAVFQDVLQLATLSFHMGSVVSTIELSGASLAAADIERVERRANELICENRPVSVEFENADSVAGLRKASGRTGEIRVVTIANLDRSACGGTHVRSTGEIGSLQIRKLDKVRGNVRVEFVCGLRASARARLDFNALSAIARTFSSGVDEAAEMVEAQAERLQAAEKAQRKLALEVAQSRGKALYESTAAQASGLRSVVESGPISDETRAIAQAFTLGTKSAFLAISSNPPAILLAVSKDSGLHAGELVRRAVSARGGKGGGSPQMGQGSLPDAASAEDARKEIAAAWVS